MKNYFIPYPSVFRILIPVRKKISKKSLRQCEKQYFDEYHWGRFFFYKHQTLSCGTFARFISDGEITQPKSNLVMDEFSQNLLEAYSLETLQKIAAISQIIADKRNLSAHRDNMTKEEMDKEWTDIVSQTNKLIRCFYPPTEKDDISLEPIDTNTMHKLANFCEDNEMWKQALRYYQDLHKQKPEDTEISQKMEELQKKIQPNP